jgi:hypothetical protein
VRQEKRQAAAAAGRHQLLNTTRHNVVCGAIIFFLQPVAEICVFLLRILHRILIDIASRARYILLCDFIAFDRLSIQE